METIVMHDSADLDATARPAVDPAQLRAAFGQFPTGVTVITTRAADGRKVGLTANSFSSLSLDPPLVLWSLRKAAPSCADFVASTHFAINILAHDQIDLSRRFATPHADKFDGVLHVASGAGGVPCLEGASARFVCRNVSQYEGGDHLIFIGRIEQFDAFGKAPLVFHAGQYRAIAAHPALSCPV
ncbi:flavin reductase family protein [Burkholderia sp. Ac-20353]|uniref:flavin reductase family protein n=1 Tax=Burkholderia sp. Ac-20353 TaxID=2703894 RepID=UPI00197B0B36|nr:flavin reductase family protein [Burkholderia sp. Ac-20353]